MRSLFNEIRLLNSLTKKQLHRNALNRQILLDELDDLNIPDRTFDMLSRHVNRSGPVYEATSILPTVIAAGTVAGALAVGASIYRNEQRSNNLVKTVTKKPRPLVLGNSPGFNHPPTKYVNRNNSCYLFAALALLYRMKCVNVKTLDMLQSKDETIVSNLVKILYRMTYVTDQIGHDDTIQEASALTYDSFYKQLQIANGYNIPNTQHDSAEVLFYLLDLFDDSVKAMFEISPIRRVSTFTNSTKLILTKNGVTIRDLSSEETTQARAFYQNRKKYGIYDENSKVIRDIDPSDRTDQKLNPNIYNIESVWNGTRNQSISSETEPTETIHRLTISAMGCLTDADMIRRHTEACNRCVKSDPDGDILLASNCTFTFSNYVLVNFTKHFEMEGNKAVSVENWRLDGFTYGNASYEPIGTIHNTGVTVLGGHYIAFLKYNDEWNVYDDMNGHKYQQPLYPTVNFPDVVLYKNTLFDESC